EAIGCLARRVAKARPGQEKQIHPSVVVIVDKSAAAPHSLEDVLLLVLLTVHHRPQKARLLSDVHKMCMEGNSRRLCATLWLHARADPALPKDRLTGVKRQSRQASDKLAPLHSAQQLSLPHSSGG